MFDLMHEGRFKAFAASFAARNIDDRQAVILACGRMAGGLSIIEARELANGLAKAADEAELKLDEK